MSRRMIQNPHQWTVLDGSVNATSDAPILSKSELRILNGGRNRAGNRRKAVKQEGANKRQYDYLDYHENEEHDPFTDADYTRPAGEVERLANDVADSYAWILILSDVVSTTGWLTKAPSVRHAKKFLSVRGIARPCTDKMPIVQQAKMLLSIIKVYHKAMRCQLKSRSPE